MYTVYIIQSIKNHRYYIGQTSNIENKIKRHNLGQVKSTRNYIPWKIIKLDQRPAEENWK